MPFSSYSPRRSSYIISMRRKFLRTLKPNELSTKVLTTWRGGDLFVGSKHTADSIGLDPDLLQFGGRQWGGGNGFGEGYAHFDPIEVEGFKSVVKNQAPIIIEKDNEGDDIQQLSADDEMPDVETFFVESGQCKYPGLCFGTVRNKKAVFLWISHIVLVLALFAAAIYFSWIGLTWIDIPAWAYLVMAGLCLIIPLISWCIVVLTIWLFRRAVNLVLNPKRPEKAEYLLNILYLNEKVATELIILLTFFFYTISFLLLFQNYPQDNGNWANGYRYTSAVLGTLTVWALGGVIVQYLTHFITKEVNVHSLGSKVRAVLRAEVALWRIVELLPHEADLRLYRLMEDPFLTYDPRKASQLARAMVETPMSALYRPKYTKNAPAIPIKIDNDAHANVLGCWAYACMMKGSIKNGYASLKKGTVTRWRSSSSSGSLVNSETIIEEYYSTKDDQLAKFKMLYREAMEQNPQPIEGHSFSIAHHRYPELDLAWPLEYRKEGIALAVSDYKWSRIGVIRGIPKRYITKKDLEASLRTHDPSFTKLPEVDLDAAWEFFDPEHVGKVVLKRAKNAVRGLVQDRKNLKVTLENTSQVVVKLRAVIAVGINFFVFLCALAIFGLSVLNIWVSISSIVLAFSFIFGGTLKGVFDSVVFLFGVHPYDVGDKIKLGSTEEVYWVKRISLMSTQMVRWDGAYVRFMNPYLFNVYPLINVRRSGNHEKTISVFIDAASLPSKQELEKMQFELEQFLARSPGSFTGSCSITARDIIQPLHVKITIWFAFAYSDIDSGRTNRDTNKVIHFLIGALTKRAVSVSGVNTGHIELDAKAVKKIGLQAGTTRVI